MYNMTYIPKDMYIMQIIMTDLSYKTMFTKMESILLFTQ